MTNTIKNDIVRYMKMRNDTVASNLSNAIYALNVAMLQAAKIEAAKEIYDNILKIEATYEPED